MARTRRTLAVTAGAAVAGALSGAVCTVIAVTTPLIVSQLIHPDPDRLFATLPFLVGAAVGGATVGAVCGPLLAWGLVRHVPLWRVIAWTATGTVVGALYGLAAGTRLPVVFLGLISGTLLGMIGGAVLLRQRVARESHLHPPSALPDVR